MGLCCSCLEDDTRPHERSNRPSLVEDQPWPPRRHPVNYYDGEQSWPNSVRSTDNLVREQPRQQRRQQMPSANHFLAPATTSTTTTVSVVQQSHTRPKQKRCAPAVPSTANVHNLLIKPGVTVKIAPKSITQQVTIVKVQQCGACGKSDHTSEVCRYRERLCFYCREEGHIIAICPAKKRQQQRKHAQRKRQHTTKRY